jgi:hypothetical protein
MLEVDYRFHNIDGLRLDSYFGHVAINPGEYIFNLRSPALPLKGVSHALSSLAIGALTIGAHFLFRITLLK